MAETVGPVIRLAPYFGAVGGGAPDYSSPPSEEWRVDRIDASDPRRPVAYLSRALETFPVDRTSLFSTREVHVWACDSSVATDDDDYRLVPVFWGQVTQNALSIRAGERETAIATISKFHFGEPLEGEQVYSPDDEAVSIVHRDVRFNPTIDARVLDNCAAVVAETGYPTDYNLWIDPESVRTEEAADVHKQFTDPDILVIPWTLPLAVRSLQELLNANEDFIDNSEIDLGPPIAAPFDNAEDPENVTLRRGWYLPECLDALLPQHGLSWFVGLTIDETPGYSLRFTQPELAYYERGVGTEKDVALQAPGSALDPDSTDLLAAEISFDIGSVINRVVCHGGRQEREVTLELVPAWAESDDSLSVEDVTRGISGSQFEDKPHVHRKWVFNEAGDYDGLRTTLHPITERPDLSAVFDGYVPRRRKIYPPLTYRNLADTETEGIRGPVKVEYAVGASPTDDDWIDITGETNGRFIVLPNEIGVYFHNAAPPEVLVEQLDDDLHVRVTGTLVGDQCLTSEADVPSWHPNQDPVTLLLDVGDRYFDRQRQDTGDYASALTGDHDSRDDQTALDAFATAMRDQNAASSVDARITLSGIRVDYAIGDLLTGISGRNISFNRSADSENPLYVQVVGRVFDGNAQTTTLIVKPYDTPGGGS
jgi:hypothetical protein